MANICNNDVTILGTGKDVKEIHDIINKSDGYLWLGDLVNALGGNADDIYCRGEIDYCDCTLEGDESKLTLHIQSAWAEPYEVFAYLQERFPDITIYYIAEEPGGGYYATNDPNAPMFMSDFDCEVEYHKSLEEFLQFASETFGRKFATREELDKFLEDKDDCFYGEYKFEQHF